MPFDENKTYSDPDSEFRVDLLSLSRLELADAAFLVDEARSTNVARLTRLFLEGSVTKIATSWQLFIKGCKYVEKGGSGLGGTGESLAGRATALRNAAHQAHIKGSTSAVGRMGDWRSALFHEGTQFLDQVTSNPVAQVGGRGFVGVRVFEDAKWTIEGYRTLAGSKGQEWAMTSDGLYCISNPRTPSERWTREEDSSTTVFKADDDVFKLLEQAQAEMGDLLNKLESLMSEGIDGTPMTFLNEGGSIQLHDASATYDLGARRRLEVKGELTTKPRPRPE